MTKLMLILGLALGAWCVVTSPLPAADLSSLFDPTGAIWKTAPDQFMTENRANGFHWVSDAKQAARASSDDLTFLDHRVWETIARFDDGKVVSVSLSLFNRGDAGDLSTDQFEELLGELNREITAWAGEKGVQMQDEQRTNVITVRRRAWVKGPQTIEMTWSFTAKSRAQGTSAARPEYIQLRIAPFDPGNDPRQRQFARVTRQTADRPLNVLELRARAKRMPNGDVIVQGVPMVDQGQKGYCAAAVAERLLRYYGRDVTQHEIAQIANTDASTGTGPEQMIGALRKIGDELDLEIYVNQDFDFNDFKKLVADYNRLARRADQPEIDLERGFGQVINLGDVYRAFDPALFVEARGKRSGSRDNFFADVQRSINAGAPLAWSVMLGKIEETPAVPGAGGHLRLISGYNPAQREIIYTDTWGRGHEEKRMNLDHAWAITLGLYTVHPPSVRF